LRSAICFPDIVFLFIEPSQFIRYQSDICWYEACISGSLSYLSSESVFVKLLNLPDIPAIDSTIPSNIDRSLHYPEIEWSAFEPNPFFWRLHIISFQHSSSLCRLFYCLQ
jgi:hypothetical protein